MPYKNAPVPRLYDPAYYNRELQRVGEAYNVEEAFGGIVLSPLNDPAGVAQTVTSTPTKIFGFRDVAPDPTIGDGFVSTVPRPNPDNNLTYQIDGTYQVSVFGAYEHDQGAELIFELYYNNARTYLGAINDTSQQSTASSFAFAGMFQQSADGVIDVRVSTPGSDEDVTWISLTMQVYKIRDLRTRFA